LGHRLIELEILQRGEAIQVLREIINVCRSTSAVISSISLTAPSKDNGLMGDQLKIGTRLDDACRRGLMPLFKKQGLGMEENEDYVIIFKRQKP
jgi:hypothetical protein